MKNDAALEDTGRGLTVCWQGRYLYSRRDPSARPDRIAEAAPLEHRCLYFVPSPLLGHGMEKLAERLPDDSQILALEVNQDLMAACSAAIDPHLTSNPLITWVRLSDNASIHEVLYRLGPWKFRRIRRVELSGGAVVDRLLYDNLEEFISRDLAAYWKNRHALGRLGRQWIRHAYANLAAWETKDQPDNTEADIPTSKVTIVAGAGPSLEESFSFIRENRSDIRLLAADTALPALLDAGIVPDAVVALETQAWNFLDFHGSASSGIPVYADLTSYPAILEYTGGSVKPFSSDFAELDWLRRLDDTGLRCFRIPPLGSVGLAAVEIALETGTGPVILTGLDFAYQPGKTHARGSSVHKWQMANIARLDPMPGYAASMLRPRLRAPSAAGGNVRTDIILKGYASLLTDRFASTGRLYLLSPGGLNLDIPVLDKRHAAELLKRSESVNASPCRQAPEKPPAFLCRRFLDEEVAGLTKIIREWDDYARGSATAKRVAEALVGMDQIFCDFPDEPPLPNDNDAFLVRAVSRTRSLLKLIRRIREIGV
ncbi:MAG: 6-hydroxymethylpterin diphosphokinase MptE-like protein [Spirochaetaceae bacterium]|nr:DUF115 domain-containing protein [Spirochaetaceae bacterium]MDT8298818.1 6-hydroxymethylpterin diphosphokinase MptE-like protein [Spirochaetaceae bacterium]